MARCERELKKAKQLKNRHLKPMQLTTHGAAAACRETDGVRDKMRAVALSRRPSLERKALKIWL
jgi:hypothetical protein